MNETVQRSRPALPRQGRLVFGLLVFGFVATAAYWIVWFFVDRNLLASAHTKEYFAFENAFPAADAWMALSGLAGAIALQRRKASALFWCIAAGSTSLYLAGLDILFDLENGIYRASSGDWGAVVVELIINALTLFMGGYVVFWAWQRRKELARFDGW
ncbi:MAG TPA: hypothetical protein VGP93_05335 [Polyangiaceae bacterium]|jgi:hypothetical protein|nr:hypothetical protein [Polyangiaceae bacterium]